MKGKHEKDMCDRCSRWKADCKEISGKDYCSVCFEYEQTERELLRKAIIDLPDWSDLTEDV